MTGPIVDGGDPGAAAEERALPRSARGRRTRQAVITAARAVFERDGFLDARISDITEEAGVASGSFYTYFDSKEAVFAAVVEEVQDQMLHPHLAAMDRETDIVAAIEANNRAYLMEYKRNAKLMALFEQVAQIDDDFRTMRRNRGYAFAERSARTIRRLQEEGRADPELDPMVAALAIGGMVGRMAYSVYVLGQKVPFEKLVQTLTRLWVNALQLRVDP
jgi:AcrR family transcriptional regulator